MTKTVNKPKYRKKTRELLIRIVFQMTMSGVFSNADKDAFLSDTSLYSGDVSNDKPPGCIFNESAGESPDLTYLNFAFLCLKDNLAHIDSLLDNASEKWVVGRMSAVDLAILRVAVAELLYIDDIDDSTSINEAVLMAKKYGSEKSSGFVNGILGAIARSDSLKQP